MKINDRKELHSKTTEELEKLLKESYNTLSQIRMDNVQSKLKNTRSMTNTRKEIAVMKTILAEKVTAAAKVEKKEVAEAPKK